MLGTGWWILLWTRRRAEERGRQLMMLAPTPMHGEVGGGFAGDPRGAAVVPIKQELSASGEQDLNKLDKWYCHERWEQIRPRGTSTFIHVHHLVLRYTCNTAGLLPAAAGTRCRCARCSATACAADGSAKSAPNVAWASRRFDVSSSSRPPPPDMIIPVIAFRIDSAPAVAEFSVLESTDDVAVTRMELLRASASVRRCFCCSPSVASAASYSPPENCCQRCAFSRCSLYFSLLAPAGGPAFAAASSATKGRDNSAISAVETQRRKAEKEDLRTHGRTPGCAGLRI